MMDQGSRPGHTGLTLMLFDAAGNAQAATDWQDAADRIVRLLGAETSNDVWAYARAHRILQALWPESPFPSGEVTR